MADTGTNTIKLIPKKKVYIIGDNEMDDDWLKFADGGVHREKEEEIYEQMSAFIAANPEFDDGWDDTD